MSDIIYTNSSKRLPIVFCLDISPSMDSKDGSEYSRIQLLNIAIKAFLKEIKNDLKVRTSAEIALVAFSTNIELDTPFESVSTIDMPYFTTVEKGGTRMANAILRSIEKIESKKKDYENAEISYYVPFFVLVTDGNPNKNDDAYQLEQAIAKVQKCCDSHIGASEIIIPFIIGVGDNVEVSTLNRLAEQFTGTAIIIDSSAGEQDLLFEQVFKFIGKSITGSIHLNDTPMNIINPIKENVTELTKKIEENRRYQQ